MSKDYQIPATLSDIMMLNESELMNGDDSPLDSPRGSVPMQMSDTGETLSFLKHFNTPESGALRFMSFDEEDVLGGRNTGDFHPKDLPSADLMFAGLLPEDGTLDDDVDDNVSTTTKKKKKIRKPKTKEGKGKGKGKKDHTFFGVSSTSRKTRDGRVSYFKIKVKHKGVEYYIGIRHDKFEGVMAADAGYVLVGELIKSNLERARKHVARDSQIKGNFKAYVSKLAKAIETVIQEKITEIGSKPISKERKEKTEQLWRNGIRTKWGNVFFFFFFRSPLSLKHHHPITPQV